MCCVHMMLCSAVFCICFEAELGRELRLTLHVRFNINSLFVHVYLQSVCCGTWKYPRRGG